MTYSAHYHSPIGGIILACEGEGLTGLWLDGKRYHDSMPADMEERADMPILRQASQWLDRYFAKEKPGIGRQRGIQRMSAQAIGGAVGHNPISIIIPCHRVVGADGSLTGYGGGIQKKVELLTHEGVDMERFFVPEKGTAL